MQIIDDSTKTRGFQAMVGMRDGTRLEHLRVPAREQRSALAELGAQVEAG
ncbi:MAG TPA: hypothetical protein VNZ53_26125 [Steroidobacteraceae bacterium]|jgi:hypothetical protein|nr:hypothetical protein [Steroidobacteraceae bacterium]